MKAKNVSYPYPVLGNEDDVRGEFNVSFKHVLSRDKIKFKVAFKLKNETLERLIKEEKAAFTVEMECGSTFFRSNFRSFEKHAEFSIKSALVRGHVNVGFFIRAIAPITKYKIENCHPDYEGFAFDINPGDILAIGGFTSFVAEKDFDPMKPSVSSFMVIKQGNFDSGPMEVDYSDDEKIKIKLSKADWGVYALIKGRKTVAGMLHSSIVLPVLADAIALVQSGNAELQGTHWFNRIDVILRQQQLSEEEALIAAQKILKNPLERGLLSIADSEQD